MRRNSRAFNFDSIGAVVLASPLKYNVVPVGKKTEYHGAVSVNVTDFIVLVSLIIQCLFQTIASNTLT